MRTGARFFNASDNYASSMSGFGTACPTVTISEAIHRLALIPDRNTAGDDQQVNAMYGFRNALCPWGSSRNLVQSSAKSGNV
ncbi:hypothetical protein F7P69_12910 [Cellulosimicrobium funkei]|nr:hypothetical protein [Cellulosimicrobium funkei]